jgi:CRISPR/Cas system-associated exonuclease Cas4 (RecB family)
VDMTQNESMKKIKEIQEKYGDVNLVDMLHHYLIEEDQANQQKRYEQGRIGKFYPSSVGSCKRKIAYQMMGYPGKPKQGRMALILDNGTYFHERMEKYYADMGIMVAPELKLKDAELRISGRSDAIIYNFLKKTEGPVEGDKMITLYKPIYDEKGNETGEELVYEGWASDVLIVEFKSAKDKSYEDYTPKTKPQKKHEMQLQLYFYLTGIRAGMVYYENKNTQDHKYYYVEYNQKIIDEIVSDIQFVIKHIDSGTLPEREFQPTSFDCRYCDFRDICHPVLNSYNLDDII